MVYTVIDPRGTCRGYLQSKNKRCGLYNCRAKKYRTVVFGFGLAYQVDVEEEIDYIFMSALPYLAGHSSSRPIPCYLNASIYHLEPLLE